MAFKTLYRRSQDQKCAKNLAKILITGVSHSVDHSQVILELFKLQIRIQRINMYKSHHFSDPSGPSKLITGVLSCRNVQKTSIRPKLLTVALGTNHVILDFLSFKFVFSASNCITVIISQARNNLQNSLQAISGLEI